MKNWAGNLAYSAAALATPSSLDELADVVAKAPRIKALGSRHCFNRIADTSGTQVVLDGIGGTPEIDTARSIVRVPGHTRYSDLGIFLQAQGFALANMASLPHISVAGAIQTGTHGSGSGNPSLASAVQALELMGPDGTITRFAEADGDGFFGSVVGLGALGLVTYVELAIEPTYDVVQHVFEHLPWDAVLPHFDQIMASAYSASLFTDYHADSVAQAWLKSRIANGSVPYNGSRVYPDGFFGAQPATRARHPLPDMSGENCTPQLGAPGPWLERLPHFVPDFTPSSGDELQSEYILPLHHAAEGLNALRSLGDRLAPLLYVSEIRTIAGDRFWLSPAYGHDCVGFHLTWRPRQSDVEAILPAVEAALAPLEARPHWGKLFHLQSAELAPLYPRFEDFRQLVQARDPNGKFRNNYLERALSFD